MTGHSGVDWQEGEPTGEPDHRERWRGSAESRGAERSDATDPLNYLAPDHLAAWVELITLADRIVTLADGELHRRHGITGRDYQLLHHLSQFPDGVRVSELAALIDDTSGCITHRINRLTTAGLVSKRVDAADRRVRRVALRPKGQRLLADAAPGHAARVRHWVIDPLDERDLRALRRVMARLNAHLRATAPVE